MSLCVGYVFGSSVVSSKRTSHVVSEEHVPQVGYASEVFDVSEFQRQQTWRVCLLNYVIAVERSAPIGDKRQVKAQTGLSYSDQARCVSICLDLGILGLDNGGNIVLGCPKSERRSRVAAATFSLDLGWPYANPPAPPAPLSEI